MRKANSISAVVGQSVRKWREEAGLTQQQVANVAAELGFDWQRGTVASIEGGHREVSLSEFLALPFFSQLAGGAGSWNRLVDFLPPEPDATGTSASGDSGPVLDLRDASVELTPGCWVQAEHLRALLAGHPTGGRRVPKDALVTWRDVGETMQGLASSVIHQLADTLSRFTPKPQEAELKAAKRLSVSVDEVLAAALTLWGKTLTAEREARSGMQIPKGASARSTQAIRGHITRDLLGELRTVLETKGGTK